MKGNVISKLGMVDPFLSLGIVFFFLKKKKTVYVVS